MYIYTDIQYYYITLALSLYLSLFIGLIAVCLDARYKTLGEDLRSITDSFRVYKLKSGIFAMASKEEEKGSASASEQEKQQQQ